MLLRTPGILAQQEQRLHALYGLDVPWSSFLTNHDQERISNKLEGQDAKLAFAAKLFFAQPGVPFIYYGDEIGMTGAKPDPELRTPMPWTGDAPNGGFTRPDVKPWHALTGDFANRNVEREQADPRSLWTLYRRLIRLNASSPALRHGEPIAVSSSHRRVYAALRSTPEETVLVLANFDDQPVRSYALDAAQSPLSAGAAGREEIDGVAVKAPTPGANGGFAGWQPIAELPGNGVYVVRWKR
jgi:glycosidase